MSLQLILGNSGSGKSHVAYERIIEESMQSPQKKFLVIVPEQFTMQTQKEFVRLHPKRGILNIDILSFQRLAFHVFEEVGADRRTVLEETGKNLLLRKAALEQQENLKVLRGNLRKPGYISEMKSVISEFRQYDVTPEDLDEMIRLVEDRPELAYKLADVRTLYQAFVEKQKDTYITAEEILDVLCHAASKSELLRDSVILLDGFTGFTPVQQRVLRRLMTLSERMMLTVTIDARENPWHVGEKHELFYLSKKTIHTVSQLAKEEGVRMEAPVILGGQKLFRFQNAPALAFLERNFLRHRQEIYDEKPQEVTVHAALNAVGEVRFAARKILELVRKGQYRYQDIAVITGDLASYGEYARRIFSEYGIPCFVDETKKVLLNPFLEYIRAALEMAAKNFSYESVFRYLKTGLCGLSAQEVDLLENYVLAAGKRSIRAWRETWEKPVRTVDAGQTALCDELRQRVVGPLLPFLEVVKDRKTTARDKTQALYTLIAGQEVQKQLKEYELRFTELGNLDAAKEYSQIYGVVMNLFDKVVDLLGEEAMTLREYTEILEAGFEEARVGIIPPAQDQVVVGDLKRSRLKQIKALIFLGLNDGYVPANAEKFGILSEMDREAFADGQIELAPGVREQGYMQRFYLYQNLTKPSERLMLSYSRSKMDGSAMRPSYLVSMMTKMYPKLQVVCEDEKDRDVKEVLTPKTGIPYLIAGLRLLSDGEMTQEWAQLYNWYCCSGQYQEQVKKLVEAAFLTRSGQGLEGRMAKALYGSVLENSVSRLERFAACAYAHFLMYGLRLGEREEFAFQPVDMGNLFHKALELFSEKMASGAYTWHEIPEEVRQEWASQCVDEALRLSGNEVLYSSARNQYAIERIKRIMGRTVWALCEQIRKGEFVPDGCEVSFSAADHLDALQISLTEQEKMRLRGRIDRVDICEKEDAVYVKVIDYKSGGTEFDMVALYYGLQLQLVVYLNAAMELEGKRHPGKDVIPAGIFYYRMQDPMVACGGRDTERIEKEILKKLKLNGLVNSEKAVIESMDTDMRAGKKTSEILPVTRTKDGFSKASSVAGREQFEQLSAFVHEKMKEIGRRILRGETEAVPYERKERTACDFCSYQEICGFDRKIPGTKVRRICEYDRETVWKKIGGSKDGDVMD